MAVSAKSPAIFPGGSGNPHFLARADVNRAKPFADAKMRSPELTCVAE